MGGVVADVDGSTGVPGLYAAGEVVGGVHGANRHGGNALTDITVFGARAGAATAQYSRDRRAVPVDDLARDEFARHESLRRSDGGTRPGEVMSRLRDLMWERAGIVRDERGLREALREISELRGLLGDVGASDPREMLVALETPMALDAAEMIARAALERRESRGAHFRSDHPAQEEAWYRIVILERGAGGEMAVSTRPV
jgi:succinate dehydrogenase / fumarate reductase flavoprotein subunit